MEDSGTCRDGEIYIYQLLDHGLDPLVFKRRVYFYIIMIMI